MNSLVSIFVKYNFDYETCEVPDDAVHMLDRHEKGVIGLIIVDYQMPNINGIELAKKIRAMDKFSDTPMVLLSQYKELFIEHKKAGAENLFYEFLFKGDVFTDLPIIMKKLIC
jgi:CheY-like chemotaxis protein